MCVYVCEAQRVSCVLEKSSPWMRASLHLVEEVSAAVVLHAAGEDLAAGLRHQQGVFELSRALPVSGHRRPAVGPRLVLPATFTYHGFNGEHVARLHNSHCFVFGIMWHIGSSVEKSMDAVAAVAAHHREAVSLSVLLYDVP